MSADNFYIVRGNQVWQGFASDYAEHMEEAEKAYYDKLATKKPMYEGTDHDDALSWATGDYAEYGVWEAVE